MHRSKAADMIEKLMDEHGIESPTELARKIDGVNQPTLSRILQGIIDDPGTKVLRPIADYFRITVGQLRQEEYYAPSSPDTHITSKALDLARKWDALPSDVQSCIAIMIDTLSKEKTKSRSKIKA